MNTVCSFSPKAMPSKAKEAGYLCRYSRYSARMQTEVYMLSHWPHTEELRITVGIISTTA